ncbi:MAG: DUF839 domain-containing protein [Deltaproteobacteria bacterium]|nr:DUF839 domain-containing protein [Deltaproteobacteria bacterium]
MDGKGGIFGLLFDRNGNPLKAGAALRISNRPDGDSVFERRGKYYLLTHFEESPGAIYLTEMAKSPDGRLKPVHFRNIDLSMVGGTVINCAASKTPWDTHLASEEDYFFDAYWFDPATKNYTAQHIDYCDKGPDGELTGGYTPPQFAPAANLSAWCGYVKGVRDDYLKDNSLFTPYNYGFNIEISLDEGGNPLIVNGSKHYALGKFTPEIAVVMPDSRTVYLTDDGDYAGLFMFVADKEKDLSSGALYMAKWVQRDSVGGGAARVEWVKLGHGNEGAIKSLIDRRPVFSDIFDLEDPLYCPDGFKLLKSGAAGIMCLRLKDGTNGSAISDKFEGVDEVKRAAAFLESRKYGAYLGATSEFHKAEGLAYNPYNRVLYLAVSSLKESMLDITHDPANDIRLPGNRCGAVYEGRVSGNKRDTHGRPVNSSFVLTSMESMLEGKPLKPGELYAGDHACHPAFIANPDNLGYYGGLLFIGEDSSGHFNNMVWAYDTGKKTLTRIMTVPTGGEVTGSFAQFKSKRVRYMFINIQHPLEDSARNAMGVKVNSGFLKEAGDGSRRGYVGYISLPETK